MEKNTSSLATDQSPDAFCAERGCTKAPGLIQWITTRRCELACAHCFADSGPDRAGELSTEQALRFVDEMAELGVSQVLLTGGEPLGRRDLPEIIGRIALRSVSYSLNTARMPRGRVRDALEKHPPDFVAVSVDGPRRIHDAFRGMVGAYDEAMDAISFFKRAGSVVAAGTAVMRANIGHLTETLSLVVESGADRWGLHPLVPEGRAASHPDLFPSRRELRSVLRFVAHKRNYFRLELTDESGHCGDFEPLIRDHPMICGAGRVQCALLPNGDVVPCTSLDRAAVAGNVTERSLREIWQQGFAALRQHHARAGCARCEYFAACGGGCWLQRHSRTRCFRDVWEPEKKLMRAAGVVVGLGLAACSGGREDATSAPAQPTPAPAQVALPPARETPAVGVPGVRLDPSVAPAPPAAPFASSRAIDEAILRYSTLHANRPQRANTRPPADRASDPAWRFLDSLSRPAPTQDLSGKLQALRAALTTREQSLGVAALAFRVLSESLLEGTPPEARSEALRREIRDTLAALEVVSGRWHWAVREAGPLSFVFERPPCERSMAGCGNRPTPVAIAASARPERANPRLPGWNDPTFRSWLSQHPHGEGLRLLLTPASGSVTVVSTSGARRLDGAGALDVYTLLVTGAEAASVAVGWRDWPAVAVTLPALAELTWVDLLRLADEQHRTELDAQASGEESTSLGWSSFATHETDPRLLLAMRRLDSERARWWLADFWLY